MYVEVSLSELVATSEYFDFDMSDVVSKLDLWIFDRLSLWHLIEFIERCHYQIYDTKNQSWAKISIKYTYIY